MTNGREVIPSRWNHRKISEVTTKVGSGSTPRGGESVYQDSGVPLIRSMNVHSSGFKSDGLAFIDAEEAKKLDHVIVQPSDVLLNITGASIGRVTTAPTALAGARVNQHVCIIRPKEELSSSFLSYFLASPREQARVMNVQVGATRQALTKAMILDWDVPVPPFHEQQEIVAEIEKQFSRLDEAIATLKRVKANLKRYEASVLKAAVEGKLTEDWRKQHPNVEPASKLLERILAERRAKWNGRGTYKEPIAPDTSNLSPLPQGWTWASVDQVAEVLLGKMLDQNKHRTGRRLPYLRNINVRWGRVQTEDLLEMFFESDELGRYGLKPGDVLVCEGGEPGRAAVWDGRIPELKYQKALHRVRFYGTIDPRYLVFLLEFLADTGRLERWFTGSTIKHFTRESFISLPIQMPSLKEQEQIVAEVERRLSIIEELEAVLEANLIRADRLRQSILATAFAGKLVKVNPAKMMRESTNIQMTRSLQ